MLWQVLCRARRNSPQPLSSGELCQEEPLRGCCASWPRGRVDLGLAGAAEQSPNNYRLAGRVWSFGILAWLAWDLGLLPSGRANLPGMLGGARAARLILLPAAIKASGS